MIKAVLFDFDYTLGDSSEGIVQSAGYALERLGLAVPDAETIKKTIGLSMRDTLHALGGGSDPEQVKLFTAYFREKADAVMTAQTVLYEGVTEVLAKLKEQGYMTGIVTTKYHYRIDAILARSGGAGLVDVIVGAEDVRFEKPDPEGLLAAVRSLGISRDEVLYVGDSTVDAKTAAGAGVRFAAVLSGKTSEAEFRQCGPVPVFPDIRGVYRHLCGRQA